ncbi:uncharacterized protein LOC120354384 [Nilaparvata lugens]|uniref:uncharacterized protein LOC120354384 n=1 Tax=Nilaparvata lugens TaxID=108931 RepID=UPI00193E61F1|nr:uncharacterized protein LOC120354384 [Nilaparvata lugens]
MGPKKRNQSRNVEVEKRELEKFEGSVAQFQVATAEAFNFREPQGWSTWITRFERITSASNLSSKSERCQVDLLKCTLCEEGEDLLKSFRLIEEEAGCYEIVEGNFEAYFGIKKNVVYERTKCFKRRQSGELVDSFVNDLHKLAEGCNFGNLREELIRDLIVIGVLDNKVSEILQLDDCLTLERAIVSRAESIKKQQAVVRDHDLKDVNVLANSQNAKPTSQSLRFTNTKKWKCYKCGFSHDQNGKCLALASHCFKCNVVGHFGRVCKQGPRPNVREVETDNQTPAESYFGELTIDQLQSQDPWTVSAIIGKHQVNFKLETGADVSVIGSFLCKS